MKIFRGVKLFIAVLLWLPVITYGAGLYDFVPGGSAVVVEANLEPLRGTELEKEIKNLNRTISTDLGGQYDFSKISEQLKCGVFTWNGSVTNPDFTVLVQGDMGEAAFNRILADSVDEPLLPLSIDGRPALRFPQESLNKNLRGKMDLVSAFVTGDIVMIGDIARVKSALHSSGASGYTADAGGAFLRFSGMPSDPVVGMFFRGVKNAVIEAAVDESGSGIELTGVALCRDATTASAMATNMKMLAQAFMPLFLERDLMLQRDVLKALEIANVDDKVELSCKLNGATVKRLFRYAAKETTRKNR